MAIGVGLLVQYSEKTDSLPVAKGFWDLAENVINVPLISKSDDAYVVTVPCGLLNLDLSKSGELLHVELIIASKVDWVIVPDIQTPVSCQPARIILNGEYDSSQVGKYYRNRAGDRLAVIMSPNTKSWLRIANTIVVGIDERTELTEMIFERVVKDVLLARMITWQLAVKLHIRQRSR